MHSQTNSNLPVASHTHSVQHATAWGFMREPTPLCVSATSLHEVRGTGKVMEAFKHVQHQDQHQCCCLSSLTARFCLYLPVTVHLLQRERVPPLQSIHVPWGHFPLPRSYKTLVLNGNNQSCHQQFLYSFNQKNLLKII